MSDRAPGPRGIAALRFFRQLERDSYRALDDIHVRYGDVVEVSAGVGPRMVLLVGRAANQFVLSEAKNDLTFCQAYRGLEPVGGSTALLLSDGVDHDRRRSLVQPAFRPRTIDSQIGVVEQEADRVIDSLVDGEVTDLYPRYRRAVRRSVIRVLFGDALSDRADEIGDLLEGPLTFVNRPVTRQLRLDIPGTAYRRTRRAVAAVDQIIDEEIDRRSVLSPGNGEPDVLDLLLAGEGGQQLTRMELRDQVRSLVAAGYDTTSSAIAWTLFEAARQPGVWDALATIADPAHDPFARGVVSETLRLHPPAVIAARNVERDLTFDGYRIPADALVMYSPYLTQRQPALWPNPTTFDPSRWQVRPDPYAFVTFGGGHRRCVGFGLATMELAIMLARTAARVDLELTESRTPTPAGIASAYPRQGVSARIKLRR